MTELMEFVNELPNKKQCNQCSYKSNKREYMAKHIALFHCKLDELMANEELVQMKQKKATTKPKRVPMGENCVVCGMSFPQREHVARHFLKELLEIVQAFEDPLACNKCDYQSEKNPISVALHLALNHDILKTVLPTKVTKTHEEMPFENAMKKVALIGDTCPVCDFKDPSREHVSRHFMNELLNHIGQSKDHKRCRQCPFQGERPQNLAIHIALCHDMLDDFLSDHELVKKKRAEAMIRPKKISIGSTCPVCLQAIQKRDSRVHVIWHFMEELREMVQEFPDTTVCNFCPYTNPNPDKMAKHMALGHSKLDELLSNQELVAVKQRKAMSKPKKLSIGPECPICGMRFTKSQNRDHVSWHFMDELRDYVQTFADSQQCNQCEYRSDKVDNLVKHLALGHSKLDELLKNEELVAAKKEMARIKPKKISIGPTCPICDLTFTKSQNRDHVSWHFVEELRDFVKTFDNPQQCWRCDYQSEKLDNMVKHCALGHSKLDELLQDQDLVNEKRSKAMAKPRRISISTCPICDVKDPAREHVARHFSEELIAIVVTYPDPTACPECDYHGDKPKTLAIHVGLVHAKLDLMLSDMSLVQKKRADFIAKPKKVSIGRSCM